MSTPYRIPFNKPTKTGRELGYIEEVLAGVHLAGDGAFTKKCSDVIQREVGADRVLLTTSCTHALEMSALLLNIEAGDEVIVPSFAFVTTANAYAMRGGTPVFADVQPQTLNLDPEDVRRKITDRTRIIVALHYAGVACDMDELLKIADDAGVAIVEDNAHGLFGTYRGRPLGSLGCLGTQSFHETKNLNCGEGGALLINDPDLVERAEILREKGTNRSRFFRGQVDKYTWVDLGSSYLPSEILAAYLWAQLEEREAIQRRRSEIWNRYEEGLREWAGESDVRLPHVPEECGQAFHMFYVLLPSLEARTALIAHLKTRGILAVFHYLPLNLSDMGRRFGGRPGDCPVTEDFSDRLLRLPFFNSLTEAEQGEVVEAIREF